MGQVVDMRSDPDMRGFLPVLRFVGLGEQQTLDHQITFCY
jgi:hypothetical protein